MSSLVFKPCIFSSNSSSEVYSGNSISVDLKPIRSQAFTLAFTYVILAPSDPTRIAARCGTFSPLETIAFTCSAISSLISLLTFLPSKIVIF